MINFGLVFSPSYSFTELVDQWEQVTRYPEVDSLFLSDHLIRAPMKPESPYRDAWTLLPALVGTLDLQGVDVGVLVTSNQLRHPMVLARSMLTMDEICQGRLIMGIGAGWYKPEHDVLGIPFSKRPVDDLEGALIRLKETRDREVVHVSQGPYLPVRHFIARPRPQGKIPIMVAGHGPRIMSLCARYGDIWNTFGTPEEVTQRNKLMDTLETGHPIERTLNVWKGLVPDCPDPWASVDAFRRIFGRYRYCGLTGYIFDAPKPAQMEIFEQCLPTIRSLITGLQTSTAR